MEPIYIEGTSWKIQSSLPYANDDNHCKLWIKWENKKTKRCPRCVRVTCNSHASPLHRIWVMHCTCTQVDISLWLKWPCGTIRAAPTQIKNTQLGAVLKAILCSQKIGIKLPGSQPHLRETASGVLGLFSRCAYTCRSGRRQGSVPLCSRGTIRVSCPSKSNPDPDTLIFPITPGSITVNT